MYLTVETTEEEVEVDKCEVVIKHVMRLSMNTGRVARYAQVR